MKKNLKNSNPEPKTITKQYSFKNIRKKDRSLKRTSSTIDSETGKEKQQKESKHYLNKRIQSNNTSTDDHLLSINLAVNNIEKLIKKLHTKLSKLEKFALESDYVNNLFIPNPD